MINTFTIVSDYTMVSTNIEIDTQKGKNEIIKGN